MEVHRPLPLAVRMIEADRIKVRLVYLHIDWVKDGWMNEWMDGLHELPVHTVSFSLTWWLASLWQCITSICIECTCLHCTVRARTNHKSKLHPIGHSALLSLLNWKVLVLLKSVTFLTPTGGMSRPQSGKRPSKDGPSSKKESSSSSSTSSSSSSRPKSASKRRDEGDTL